MDSLLQYQSFEVFTVWTLFTDQAANFGRDRREDLLFSVVGDSAVMVGKFGHR